MSDTTRLDKWLWATRFFKTRSLATKTCAGGKVKRAGQSLKPSACLRLGDQLEIPFPDGPGVRTIRVIGLIERRVSPVEAKLCFEEETPEAVLTARREALAARRERREGAQGRPTKRDRRSMQRANGYFE